MVDNWSTTLGDDQSSEITLILGGRPASVDVPVFMMPTLANHRCLPESLYQAVATTIPPGVAGPWIGEFSEEGSPGHSYGHRGQLLTGANRSPLNLTRGGGLANHADHRCFDTTRHDR